MYTYIVSQQQTYALKEKAVTFCNIIKNKKNKQRSILCRLKLFFYFFRKIFPYIKRISFHFYYTTKTIILNNPEYYLPNKITKKIKTSHCFFISLVLIIYTLFNITISNLNFAVTYLSKTFPIKFLNNVYQQSQIITIIVIYIYIFFLSSSMFNFFFKKKQFTTSNH